MEDKQKIWWGVGIVVVIIAALIWWVNRPASAATIMEKCNSETTGLKYTNVEGSGFASIFFIIPLLALAPVAGATDTTGQYRCHIAVIGRDAAGAKIKKNYRPVVEPQ